jgi:EpsI family protein
MSEMRKPVLISVFLLATIAVSFLIPRPKYTSLNILAELKIPAEFPGWRSIDVSKQLNLQDDRYNFISDVFARLYQSRKGDQLLLLILDAGNFHNPKVCYTSSGFTVKELGDVDFKAKNTAFKANALLMERQNAGMNMFYWLCINKKIVDWTGQKMIELWSSLSNKKKTGLMVRLEIPAKTKNKEEALALGRDFIHALSRSLATEQKEYLFGK